MKCPNCGSTQTSVMSTRTTDGNDAIYRRRKCNSCKLAFGTLEIIYPGKKKTDPRLTRKLYEIDFDALDSYRSKHLADPEGSSEQAVAAALDKMLPTLKSLGPMFLLPVYGKEDQNG